MCLHNAVEVSFLTTYTKKFWTQVCGQFSILTLHGTEIIIKESDCIFPDSTVGRAGRGEADGGCIKEKITLDVTDLLKDQYKRQVSFVRNKILRSNAIQVLYEIKLRNKNVVSWTVKFNVKQIHLIWENKQNQKLNQKDLQIISPTMHGLFFKLQFTEQHCWKAYFTLCYTEHEKTWVVTFTQFYSISHSSKKHILIYFTFFYNSQLTKKETICAKTVFKKEKCTQCYK